MQQPTGTTAFDPADNKYRCMCTIVHSKKGTLILTVLQAIGLVITVVESVLTSEASRLYFLWIPVVIFVCTGVALKTEKPALMWPMIIYTGFWYVLVVLSAILYFFLALSSTQVIYDTFHFGQSSLVILVLFGDTCLILGAMYAYWELGVFIKCRRYFLDKRQANTTSAFVYNNQIAKGGQQQQT